MFTLTLSRHLRRGQGPQKVSQERGSHRWASLKEAGKNCRDLFEDLRDGHNLISLLEVLSGEHLPRERGRMRFHMLQNVQLTLDFLRYRKIKLVNIRCEDIVDGNPKLTLGLIWTIILHFQISDIMVGQAENVTAKEALLRWARLTTDKYPGVNVTNFTNSWRDGLAMIAIIHRNRPDLVDWRAMRNKSARERLEIAFSVMEREYGVTRLLDPEDVDTPEPDEKSLITYVSQLYEIFPEPPTLHPLFSIEAQRKLEEYKEISSVLLRWIRESTSFMRDRHFPSNTVELKRLAQESIRFRQEEVPPRLRDKNKCQSLYRDIAKQLEGTGFLESELPHDLHYGSIDKEWNNLMSLFQERDDALHDSITGADRFQRLAEKVHREIKQTEVTLEEVEIRIEDEARRVERLHPMDAKRNCDALNDELAQCEDTIKSLHSDVKILRDGHYHEAPTLHKRVVKLEERYVSVRTLFENRLLIVLNNRSFTQQENYTTTKRIVVSESRLVETNEHFKFLQECINWCKDKLKKLNESDYGNDLAAVEKEYDNHGKEHKIIHQFHTNVDQCAAAEGNFSGEEGQVYNNLLGQLRKTYAELLSLSNKRVSDLHSLLDFLQAATQELIWLNEREETELNRDWANKSLNINDVEKYYEKLMSELEKREVQFSAVQDRGNSLVIGHHPASKTVEAYLAAMQTQWQWLLELTLCLETHLQHAAYYHKFYNDISTAEQWIMSHDEKLNTVFSVTDFGLDDGEQLLREMQDIREELSQFSGTVDELINNSKSVVPLKQRRQTLKQPTSVTAICNYKKMDMSINKGERCTVHDNSNRVKWRVTSSDGTEGLVPGVCFTIPAPNQEAIDAAEKLKRQYERCIALWQKKQLRMRQNMIFATIKVVKSWDLAQFIAMGADQRNAIRRALNEDAEKLIQEGDPNDPQLRRLRREIDEVNRLFDEFERRASEPKPGAVLVDQCNSLKEYLDMMEKMLIQRCLASIPRDLDLLEQLVIEHKQFENDLSSHELEVESIQKNFQNLSRRTPAIQRTVESITQQWDRIWALSHVYIERMKCVEMVVSGIEECTQVVSEVELKLAEHYEMPDDLDALENVHQDLIDIQQVVHDHQVLIDRLLEECRNVRTLVVKSRPSQKVHPDVDKLEEDVRKLRMRWDSVCSQIVERLRSCEAACDLLAKYRNGHDQDKLDLDNVDNDLRNRPIEDLGPSEAELELERLRTMYMKIIEKKPSLEHVNTLGGRFLREAKIYDLRLSQYKASLEEVQPSLDASLCKRPRLVSGAENTAAQLDRLNAQYQFIADELYERIAKLYNKFQHEKKFNFQLEDLSPISLDNTFRTEFNLPDEHKKNYESSEYIEESLQSKFNKKSEREVVITNGKNGDLRDHSATQILGANDDVDSNLLSGTTKQVFTSSSIQHLTPVESASQGAVEKLIKNPLTGEMLTLHQSLEAGLIDLASGTFTNPDNGEKLSLSEAAKRDLISPQLLKHLQTPCGIIDPANGRELTLLEATKHGLFNPEDGTFKDPISGKTLTPEEAAKQGFIILEKVSYFTQICVPVRSSLSLYHAIVQGFINVQTGEYTDTDSGEKLPLTQAFVKGFLTAEPENFGAGGVTLSDAISQGFIEPISGQAVDRNSGNKLTIDEAVQKGLLTSHVREVVNCETGCKLTVTEAIQDGTLDVAAGRYINKVTNEKIKLDEALERQFVYRPCTIKDCHDLKLLNTNGQIQDPQLKDHIPLLEAVGKGIVDVDLKSIKDTSSQSLLTLPEALMFSVILPEGKYRDTETGEIMSLIDAVNKGLITSVSTKTIFDIDGIKDPVTGVYISFKMAILKGIINPQTGMFTDPRTGEIMTLDDAVAAKYIQPQILDTLKMKVGMSDNDNKNMNVVEAVMAKCLDPNTGQVLDPSTRKSVPLEEAVNRGLITPEGAATLRGLLSVTVTTATITKTIKRYVTVQSTGAVTTTVSKVTLQEAKVRGLIDESNGIFHDPDTNTTIPLDEAIKQGLVTLSSEWPASLPQNEASSPDSSIKEPTKRQASPSKSPSPTKLARKSITPDKSSSTDSPNKTIQTASGASSPEKEDRPSSIFDEPGSPRSDIISPSKSSSSKPESPMSLSDSRETSPIKSFSSRPDSPMKSSGISAIGPDSPIGTDGSEPSTPARSPQKLDKHLVSKGIKSPNDSIDSAMENISDTDLTSSITSMGMDVESYYSKTRTWELPPEGWFLKDAIDQKMFDPVLGIFTIQGTDRLVSFQECINLAIIDPQSADVVDPKSKRIITLKRAFEKNILDSIGKYPDPNDPNRKLTMKEAISKKFIILKDSKEFKEAGGGRIIQITSIKGHPDKIQMLECPEGENSGNFKDIKTNETLVNETPVEIRPGIKYDPVEGNVTMEDGTTMDVVTAVKEGKLQPTGVKVKDPYTGRDLNLSEAMRKGIIDKESGEYKDKTGRKISLGDAAKFGILGVAAIIGAPVIAAVAAGAAIKKGVDKVKTIKKVDPKTGSEIIIEENGSPVDSNKQKSSSLDSKLPSDSHIDSFKDGIDTSEVKDGKDASELSPISNFPEKDRSPSESFQKSPDKNKDSETSDEEDVDHHDNDNAKSLGERMRESVKIEPKFNVAIGKAKSRPSPDHEGKPVMLQKVRRKSMKPKAAASKGVVDDETALLLENPNTFRGPGGEQLSLEEAVRLKKIDGDKGAVVDVASGVPLTINEALQKGVLDKETGNVLVPVGRSVSIPEVVSQGLYDINSQYIIHPETGEHLTLHEAVLCDIVDPVSQIVDPQTSRIITLEEAMKKGLINPEKGEVSTAQGPVSVLEAVDRNDIFVTPGVPRVDWLPPLGMTFPTVLQRGLVDADKKEIIHPVTNERKDLQSAIEKDFILVLPCPVLPNSVQVTQALECKLIDTETCLFTVPKTGNQVSINEAVDTGILQIKPMTTVVSSESDGTHVTTVTTTDPDGTQVTQVVKSFQTIVTKNVTIEQGHVLISPNEVKNTMTGEILSIEDAKKQGIISDSDEPKEKITFREAVEKGQIDFGKGTYQDPNTGAVLPIDKAIQRGFVEPAETESPTDGKDKNINIMEAFSTIYDENSGKFRDPDSGNLLSIEEAISKKVIDPDSMVYDTKSGTALSTKEAIEQGVIDVKSGDFVDPKSGNKTKIKEAAKLGLLAVLGAPILAGVGAGLAVKEVIKLAKERVKRSPSPTKTEITTTTTYINENIIPKTAEDMLNLPTITPFEPSNLPIVEVGQKMTLRIAIEGRYIDVDKCVAVTRSTGNRQPVRQAIASGTLALTDVIEIRSRTEIWIIEEITTIIEIVKTLDPTIMKEKGHYDPENDTFVDPVTGKTLTLLEAIEKGTINPDLTLVKDPQTGKEIPLSQAIQEGIVDPKSGKMINPKSGTEMTFFEAAKEGYIKPDDKKESQSKTKTNLKLDEAIEKGLLNPESGMITNPNTGESINIIDAISSNLIDPSSVFINDSRTGDTISLKEAVEIGLVDLTKAVFTDPETGAKTDLTKALSKGILMPSRRPMSLVAIVKQDLYDPKTGMIEDILLKQKLPVDEAVNRGIVEPLITECKDMKANHFITLEDAICCDLVVPQNGKLKNTSNNTFIPINEAVKKELIIARRPSHQLIDAIQNKIYDPQTGKFYDPSEGIDITLASSLKCGLVNAITARIKLDEDMKTIEDSLKQNILDGESGMLMQPSLMTLDEGVRKGHIVMVQGLKSLQQLLDEEIYDPETGLIILNGEKLTIKDAIENGLIDSKCLSVTDPRSGEPLSLEQAIKLGIIDPIAGTFKDPVTGGNVDLAAASSKGLIIEGRKKFTLYQAVTKGMYNPSTGKILPPQTSNELTVYRAIKNGIIDTSTTLAREPDSESLVSFKRAVSDGLVDTQKGIINFGRIKKLNFKEAFEQDYLVDAPMLMELRVVIMKELYNEENGKFLNPATGEWITLIEAISVQLIDPESTHVKDTHQGRLKKVDLRTAIENDLIDGERALVKNHQTGTQHTLLEAYELALIVDSRVAMSIQHAIKQGLVDDVSGLITDVNTGRKITLHECIRRLVINPSLPCYWDSKNSNCLTLVQTCREGIIDRRKGNFTDPKSGCTLSLNEALEHGMIMDIDEPLSLYDAVTMGFYDNQTGRIIQPATGRKLTLQDACKQDIIDPQTSIIREPMKEKFYKLDTAVREGLIDAMGGKYVIPDTGESLTLQEAVERMLIVISRKPFTLEEALKFKLYKPETGRFTDPHVGDKLNLAQAIEHGLVCGNTSALINQADNAMKSIKAAVEDKDIDVSKGLVVDPTTKKNITISLAFEKNLIITVKKPITFSEAVKHSAIDFVTGKFTDPETGKEYSLEEALLYELIDPDSAVIKDPRTGRYKTLKRAIKEGLIDLKKRALYDPQTETLKTLCIIFDQGTIVFLREPLAFDVAIDRMYIDTQTGMFNDPNSKEILNLKDACRLGLIDTNSVLIKDTRRRCLLQIVEASKAGALDPEKGMLLNTATSHLLNLEKAIESGLIVTPRHGMALIEALDYGLYKDTNGKLFNPHTGEHVTLGEGLSCGLIDATTNMVKCPDSGAISGLQEAAASGLLDTEGGAVVARASGTRHALPEARTRGFLLTAQQRQAMIEKYKQCHAAIIEMTDTVSEIERRLAEQEPTSENANGLRNQINILRGIKDDLDAMFRPLGTCLDGVRQVVNQGGDALSQEELQSLDAAATELKLRYENCVDQGDVTHRRLTTAMEELSKYDKEIALFEIWLKSATKILVEKERLCSDLNKIKNHEQGCRDFLGDVIAHQADLRFITMATQKFADESSDYLRTVNLFRQSLPDHYPEIKADNDSAVKEAVEVVTIEFKDLLARANKLTDKVTSVGNKQRDYTEAIEKATRWLKDTEMKVARILQEPVGADPKSVQDQLDKVKAINNDVVANQRLFDNCRQTASALVRALEGDLDANEQDAIEQPPEELYDRYNTLNLGLQQRCQELDTALVQCQGVQEGLDSLMSWLSNIELQLKNASKPASLNRDRLDEQIREHKVMHVDIMSHQASVHQINESAEALLSSASNARVAKKVETKLRELNTKYEKVVERSEIRGLHLEECSTQLDAFTVSVEHFEEWYIEIVEIVESREVLSLEHESYARKIEEIALQRDARADEFDGMIKSGKDMVSKKDVTDTAPVKDKIKNLESQWKELNDTLDDRAKSGRERSEQLIAYEQLRDKVLQWLTTTENTMDNTQSVGLEQDIVKKQLDDLKPLMKEYRDYANTVDKVNELGCAYDALLRGERPESPTRRRSSVTPMKRQSISSPLKSPGL
ncbi:unnamed protein product, partial [Meganyctiphanes norvegica]